MNRSSCVTSTLAVLSAVLCTAASGESLPHSPPKALPFSDNFTRPHASFDPWLPMSGVWRVEHVLDRMDIDRFGKNLGGWRRNWIKLQRGGLKEWAQRAANLSYYSGSKGIALTGREDWADYRFAANVSSTRDTIGLVFAWRDHESHYAVGWDLVSTIPHAARFWMAKVARGRRHELASTHIEGALSQWYRMEIAIRNRVGRRCRIEVLLDGHRVFDVWERGTLRGQVGLLSEGHSHFDDVELADNPRFGWDTAAACHAFRAKRLACDWRFLEEAGAETSTGPAPVRIIPGVEKRLVLRNPVAEATAFACDLEFGPATRMVGCALAGGDHSRVSLELRGAGSIRLVLADEMEEMKQVLAEAPDACEPNRRHRIELAFRGNWLHAYRDGRLELRARCAPFRIDHIELLCDGSEGVAFRSPTVTACPAVDRERQPKNYWYVIDPFMQHWANQAGAWLSQHSGHTTTLAQPQLWHKGDFFGACEVTIPLQPNSGVLLAAKDQTSPERYEVRVRQAPKPKADAKRDRPPQKLDRYAVQILRAGKLVEEALLEAAAAVSWGSLGTDAADLIIPVLPGGKLGLDPPLPAPAFQAALPQLMKGKKRIILTRGEGVTAESLAAAAEACQAAGFREVTVAGVPEPQLSRSENGLRSDQPLREITAHRDGRYVWVTVQGRELLSFRDPEPLTGRRVAAYSSKGIEPSQVQVERGQIKDYLFETALSDWVRIGNWEIYNRFDCDPRWFHLLCSTESCAILWNKHEFLGDFTLEYYIGNRMCESPMGWYSRMGDYNAVFGTNESRLDRGYAVIVGAWDEGWTGRATKLLRNGEEVARTDRQLVPVARPIQPLRPIREPVIAAGRDTHGAWYHVKIRRIGSNIEVWYDNELALTHDDPDPLQGAKIGLWTMDNVVVIARAQISYEHVRKPEPKFLPPPSELPPEPAAQEAFLQVTSTTHPGIFSDFETGLQGWHSRDGNRVLLTIVPATDAHPSSHLRVVNPFAGGASSVHAPVGRGVDLARVEKLSFDYKIKPGAMVNLYLKALGRCHVVQLSGPGATDGRMPLLGRVEDVRADGKWRRAEIELAPPLRELYPFAPKLPMDDLVFGNLHEGYHKAGFGGARAGDTFCLDNVQIVSVGGADAELAWSPSIDLGEGQEHSFLLDQHPYGEPDDIPDTKEAKASFEALEDRAWFFHIKSRGPNRRWTSPIHYHLQVDGRPFGVTGVQPKPGGVWRGEPIRVCYGPGKVGAPDFEDLDVWANGQPLRRGHGYTYDWSKPALVIQPKGALSALSGSDTLDVRLVSRDSKGTIITDWQVIGPFDNTGCRGFDQVYPPEERIDLDAAYRGAEGRPVRWEPCETEKGFVDFNKFWPGNDVVAYATATVTFEDGPRKAQIGLGSDDGVKVWVNGDLVHSNHAHRGYRADQDKFDVTFSKGENRVLVKVDQGHGGWNFGLKIRGWRTDLCLSYQVELAEDTTPPGRVELLPGASLPAGYPVNEDFETGLGACRALGGRLTCDDGHTMRLACDMLGGEVGFAVQMKQLRLGKYPLLVFDYQMPSQIYLNLGLLAPGRKLGVLFTDPEPGIEPFTVVPDAGVNSSWQHVELNLWRPAVGQSVQNDALQVKELRIQDFGYRGNRPGSRCYFDNLRFVPVVRSSDGLALAWQARDETAIAGYSFLWDQKSDTIPDEEADGAETQRTFTGIAEGTHYFHIRAVDSAGNWGPPSHFRFTVDNGPPQVGKPQPVLRDGSPTDGLAAAYRIPIRDDVSGLDFSKMSFQIDGESVTDLDNALTYDADEGLLMWQWCRSSPRFASQAELDSKLGLAITGIRDHAGNTAPDVRWMVALDAQADQDPPRPPKAVVNDGSVLALHSFDDGTEGWKPVPGSAVDLTSAFDEKRKDWFLSVEPREPVRGWAVSSGIPAYSAAKYPVLYFRYRLAKGTPCQVVAVVDGKWWSIALTAPSRDYDALGSVKGAAADGEWHAAVIDLHALLKQNIEIPRGARKPAFRVTQLLLGSSIGHASKDPSQLAFDNFAIVGPGFRTVRWDGQSGVSRSGQEGVRLESWDPTGISQTLIVLDRESQTVPEPERDPAGSARLTPGIWFLHARVKDGAGNWSATTHCPMYVSSPGY